MLIEHQPLFQSLSLVHCHANLNLQENNQISQLFQLAINDRSHEFHIIDTFVQAGIDINAYIPEKKDFWINVLITNKEYEAVEDLLHVKTIRMTFPAKQYAQAVLCGAAFLGRLNTVQRMIQLQTDVNYYSERNRGTPLSMAIKNNQVETTKALIEARALVNVANHSGESLLRQAAGIKDCLILKLLIEAQADVNTQDDFASPDFPFKKTFACSRAAHAGNLDGLRILINAKAEINPLEECIPPIISATHQGHGSIVEMLINAKANIDHELTLKFAAQRGDLQIINRLIAAGANPSNAEALDAAVLQGHLSVVDVLVKQGACINDGALHNAVRGGHLSIVERLLSAQANSSLIINENSPLTIAAEQGNVAIAERLIDYQANVNGCNDQGTTALHTAAIYGQAAMVDYLLHQGADENMFSQGRSKNRVGTARYLAEKCIPTYLDYTHSHYGDDYDLTLDFPKAVKHAFCFALLSDRHYDANRFCLDRINQCRLSRDTFLVEVGNLFDEQMLVSYLFDLWSEELAYVKHPSKRMLDHFTPKPIPSRALPPAEETHREVAPLAPPPAPNTPKTCCIIC